MVWLPAGRLPLLLIGIRGIHPPHLNTALAAPAAQCGTAAPPAPTPTGGRGTAVCAVRWARRGRPRRSGGGRRLHSRRLPKSEVLFVGLALKQMHSQGTIMSLQSCVLASTGRGTAPDLYSHPVLYVQCACFMFDRAWPAISPY